MRRSRPIAPAIGSSFTGFGQRRLATITPSKSGFTFSPTSTLVTLSGANLFSINFTATVSSTLAPRCR